MFLLVHLPDPLRVFAFEHGAAHFLGGRDQFGIEQGILGEEAESLHSLKRGELGLQVFQFFAEKRHYGRRQQ